MRPRVPRMVIIGHDGSRSGAPQVQLSFLRWAATHRDLDARVILLRGGPLRPEFSSVLPTTVVEAGARRHLAHARRAISSVAPSGSAVLDAALRRPASRLRDADVVVANTLAALEFSIAVAGRTPVVCHVHELDGVAERILAPGPRRDRAIARVTRFVAAGPAVSAMLRDRWGIDPDRVVTIDEFIDPPGVTADDVRRARDHVGASAGEVLIVGVGAAGPRKGTDYFVDAVRSVHPRFNARAAWVGGDPSTAGWAELAHDAASVADRLTVLPTVADPLPYTAASDIALTTAREDPYPLVMLEAAALGRAIAGFSSGGVADMAAAVGLEHLVVPVGDTAALGDILEQLCEDPGIRDRVGATLAEWVLATHVTDRLAPLLWDTIVDAA